MAFVPLVSSPHPTPDDTLPPNIHSSLFLLCYCVCVSCAGSPRCCGLKTETTMAHLETESHTVPLHPQLPVSLSDLLQQCFLGLGEADLGVCLGKSTPQLIMLSTLSNYEFVYSQSKRNLFQPRIRATKVH